MPEYVLGFKAYADAHPEIGAPLMDEAAFPSFTVQQTEHGWLFYFPHSNQVVYEPGEPAPPAGVVTGIDVSDHQSRNLSSLITQFHPDHVVVKLYQRIEVAGGRAHALAQIESARSNGCSVGGYVWLYRGVDPAQQVGDAIDLADEAALVLPILWIDFEEYPPDGSLPTVSELERALSACEARGVRAGTYTSAYYWRMAGNPISAASERPLWAANWGSEPALDTTPLFGGWPRDRVWGHQWTSTPIDRDVFRRESTLR